MLQGLIWLAQNIALGFYHIAYAVTHPGQWLNWDDPEALIRFIYYGGSVELLFAALDIVLVLTVLGMIFPRFMWAMVRGLEGFANGVGRAVAWIGLLMVFQQIVIIFLQSVFRLGEITVAPIGLGFTQSVGWFSEELKLYNAMVVALCVTYTFVQGGHVRVDLVYSAVGHRTKRVIDMAGALLFMLPVTVLTWMYAWFFLWRNLITPKVSASDKLDLMLKKARIVKWNVETIGFSPNGFNAYFLFKILMVAFTALVFLQAIAFFYRSWLEWREGPESADKYLDRDTLGAGEEAFEGTH
ncbi:C4-dicarboxylate ABC transporter permease [Pacificitalea manganoxidans]|uniref:TRAP transporter small permease protein n=1 Tax=Pacificitalea manganoxidans TaxID=1411902 RepID=A0A291M339_9RHOB|nr:TRAP transporter small permease subunit [Pacificitalea manganoxidans]ATI43349.1 C4-dicarboxylate ABC transporter permease [Pacificitalea manganoxidans]MDR6309172.1 TRAP-type mannitol/chloroaromatic compound transport system permease small subunit [Pacificitalea manganoxidans]